MKNQAGIVRMGLESLTITDVSTESVTVPAGDAGDIVDVYILKKPILDANGGFIGGNGDSSLSFSACFTSEVARDTDDADLTNGDYWVDYITGRVRGKKATSDTSITADYKIFV